MSLVVSRREFLHKTAGALAALTLHPWPKLGPDLPLPPDDVTSRTGLSLGRVTTYRLSVRDEPDRDASAVSFRSYDQLITLFGTAEGPGELAHNPVWFKTYEGYVHSSFVQPVEQRLNRPLLPSRVSQARPALLEVTMPYTDVYRRPTVDSDWAYRLYYATTHWGVAVERDEAKHSWYKLHNDRGRGYYYAHAAHLRPLGPDELAPISPGAADKRIEVDLDQQRLMAFEGKDVVLEAPVSTGAVFQGGRDFRTPAGSFRVWRKRASRHMAGGTPGIDFYDLPGVPWVSYFTGGIALHGTYWHNDYGRQRSHGCVNLPPQQARWLYRWTEPEVPADEEMLEARGTPIHVF
jgi:hypothetical protein